MKLTKLALLTAASIMATGPALADLVFPWLAYRTGPFAVGGIPVADGFNDYFTLVNERDGGIGGGMTRVIECETAYNAEKGVECYEATKGEGSLVYSPLSTSTTYQLIPKVTADDIPLHSMGYGRTSAANGKIFSHIFNYPANYWTGASVAINHILDQNNGDIAGKKIVLLHLNAGYGREPIPTLEALGEKHGFELSLIPVDGATMADQKSHWLQIRRERPDYVLMWGWGVMNQTAIQEAANIRFPMENFIGVWWSGAEADVLPAGEASHGYKALAMNGVGTDYPIFADIQKYVVDAGKASGNGDQVGTINYNRGLYNAFLGHMAVLKAQEIHGVADITPSMMRDGMEAMSITEDLMAEHGLGGFGPTFDVTCENHGGRGLGAVQQWDANTQTWNLITDFMEPDMSVIAPLIEADSAAFAAENNIEERCN